MESKEIFSFLHDHFLFKYLTDDELGQILPLFSPISLDEGEVLYRTGFPGRNFFIIVSGKIMLVDETRQQRLVEAPEHFGEKSLFKDQPRNDTAIAGENTILLAVNKRSFLAIVAAFPSVNNRLSAVNQSNQIKGTFDFPWIVAEEQIRFIDRKHINVLYSQFLYPVIFLLLTGIGAVLLNLNLIVFLPIILIISGLWGVWLLAGLAE